MNDAETLFDQAEAAARNNEADHTNEKEVRERLAGDHPVIDPVPELSLELPRGYRAGGVVHTSVEVRELRGSDEERLAKCKSEEDTFNTIISLATDRVGTIDLSQEPLSAKEEVLQALLLGERSRIYLKVVEATFGKEKELGFVCGHCEASNEVTVLLDEDFPLTYPSGDETDLQETYDFVSKKGERLTYRLPIGSDVVGMAGIRSVPERNSLLLSKIILNVDGKVPADIEWFVKNMSMADRWSIIEDLEAHQPYVDPTLKTACSSCGEEVTIPLTWGQFLQP